MGESNTFENNVGFFSNLLPFPPLTAGKNNSTNSVYLLKRHLLSHLPSAGYSHTTALPSVQLSSRHSFVSALSPLWELRDTLCPFYLKHPHFPARYTACMACMYYTRVISSTSAPRRVTALKKWLPLVWTSQTYGTLAAALTCPESIGCLAEALMVIYMLTVPVIIPDKITVNKQGCFLRLWPFSLFLFSQVPNQIKCLWKSSTSAASSSLTLSADRQTGLSWN